jgi:hypothetical protein
MQKLGDGSRDKELLSCLSLGLFKTSLSGEGRSFFSCVLQVELASLFHMSRAPACSYGHSQLL